MKDAGTSDPDAGFLNEDPKQWVPQHFTKGRKEVDGKYEYKYSVLLLVLAGLIREGG